MRDNIKPIEAGFFKFCMKNLDQSPSYDIEDLTFRGTITIWSLMNEYSNKHNVPFKILNNIVWKWDSKGIFEWLGDMWGVFHPFNFPMEYIMLIPRRTLRRVGAFGVLVNDGIRSLDYATAFTFKTLANRLDYDRINDIKETRMDYWIGVSSSNKNKYSDALLMINRYAETKRIGNAFAIALIRYVINSYPRVEFDANNANYTIRTLRKYIDFINKMKEDERSELINKNGDIISEVNTFIDNTFKDLNGAM